MSAKPCDYCGKDIEIKKDAAEGKWKPFNTDGSKHWCDRNNPTKANKPVQEIKVPGIEEAIRMIVRDEMKRATPK